MAYPQQGYPQQGLPGQPQQQSWADPQKGGGNGQPYGQPQQGGYPGGPMMGGPMMPGAPSGGQMMGPPAWSMRLGISDEPNQDCGCCWHVCCELFSSHRQTYYREAVGHVADQTPYPLAAGCCGFGDFTHTAMPFGVPVHFAGTGGSCFAAMLPICSDSSRIDVFDQPGGRQLGHVVSYAPACCDCCTKNPPPVRPHVPPASGCCLKAEVLAEAYDVQGQLRFIRTENTCCGVPLSNATSTGDGCTSCGCWQKVDGNIYPGMPGGPPGEGYGTMQMQHHLCWTCYPKWSGFEQWPSQVGDDQLLLLGMAHQWRWKVENWQRACMVYEVVFEVLYCIFCTGSGHPP